MIEILIEYYHKFFLIINDFIVNSKVLFPLLRSLISAYIFWMVFSYYPTYKKKKKLRPIIEYDIYSINYGLFQIFETVFRHQDFSVSYYQSQIRSGKLKEEDFNIALQNKCLNKTYLYPKEVASSYLVIGESLVEQYKKIEELIDKVMNLNEYASSDELILLEQVRKLLKTYSLNEKDVNKSAINIINGQALSPVVSNLGYMRKNMYELYLLYQELQKMIFIDSSYMNRNILINKVQFLYYSGKFKNCKKVIKKGRGKYENTISLFDFYELLCDFKLGKIDYKKVEKVLGKRYYNGSLVSSRSFIKVLKDDPIIFKLIKKYYSEKEVKDCFDTIEKEDKQKDLFLMQNIEISKFFEK